MQILGEQKVKTPNREKLQDLSEISEDKEAWVRNKKKIKKIWRREDKFCQHLFQYKQ